VPFGPFAGDLRARAIPPFSRSVNVGEFDTDGTPLQREAVDDAFAAQAVMAKPASARSGHH
jgi:hypothetical protein